MRGKIVPEHCGVFQIGLRVSLLGVDEDRELGRVTEEENWGIVEHPVPVTLVGVELQSKSTGVTSTVGRSLLTTDGGETSEHVRFLANAFEHVDGSLNIVSTIYEVL